MKPFLESSTKFEMVILRDINKCRKCLTGEYLCDFHAKSIKEILIMFAKSESDKLLLQTSSTNLRNEL